MPASEKQIARTIERLAKQYRPAKLPADIQRGRLGDCYDWCLGQAAKSKGKYFYVEGAAQDPDNPEEFILHAWLTDAAGINAYDPIWKAEDSVTGEDRVIPVIYLGIMVPTDKVFKWVRTTTYKSILANGWRNPELAKQLLEG